MPVTGVFIEKICPSMKNWKKCECQPLLRCFLDEDILVVASVFCTVLETYRISEKLIPIEKAKLFLITKLLHQLVQSLYSRTEADFNPWKFQDKRRH
jgi:excinuclease ABC subunit B